VRKTCHSGRAMLSIARSGIQKNRTISNTEIDTMRVNRTRLILLLVPSLYLIVEDMRFRSRETEKNRHARSGRTHPALSPR
jgi:hypothetical protein